MQIHPAQYALTPKQHTAWNSLLEAVEAQAPTSRTSPPQFPESFIARVHFQKLLATTSRQSLWQIQLEGHETIASTTEPFQKDDLRLVLVEKAGQHLRLLPVENTLQANQEIARTLLRHHVSSELKNILPEVVQTLKHLQHPESTAPPVLEQVKRLQNILQQLVPQAGTVTGRQLHDWMQHNGTFLENKLARLLVQQNVTTSANRIDKFINPQRPQPTALSRSLVSEYWKLGNVLGSASTSRTYSVVAGSSGTTEMPSSSSPDGATRDQLIPQDQTLPREMKQPPLDKAASTFPAFTEGQFDHALDLDGDLKAETLRLLHSLGTSSPRAVPLRMLVDNIEVRQASQLLSQETGSTTVVQIPLLEGNSWQNIRWAFDQQESTEDQGEQALESTAKGTRFFLQIPLSELGDLWIDGLNQAAGLYLQIYSRHQTTLQFLEATLPWIEPELRNLGFQEIDLQFKPWSQLPERRRHLAEFMVTEWPPSVASGSLIDIKV